MKRSFRPHVEYLEPRLAPAIFGTPWPDAGHLTISFVPAGTAAGPLQTVSPTGLPADWQQQVLRAFENWAAASDVNFQVVPDDGEPLGTAGAVQGDPRFGDIRVALVPLGGDSSLATAFPFEPGIGTWSGDLLLNANVPFGENGGPGYDLYSVALHEAGHTLGIGDNDSDPASALYSYYQVHTGLAPEDVQAVQDLYGPPSPDAFRNGSFRTAANFYELALPQLIDQLRNPGTALSLAVNADLSSADDVDYYRYPGGSGGFTVNLQTDSLLVARLSVFDHRGNLIQSVAATDPEHGDLSLHLNGSSHGGYYFQVESADPNFSVGSYRLQVVPEGNSWLSAFHGLMSQAEYGARLPGHNLHAATALQLTSTADGASTHVYGNLANPGDVNFYRLTAPTGTAPETMNVMAFAQQANGFSPTVAVYDAQGNPVNAQLVLQNSGSMVVQVPDAVPGARYYLSVQSGVPSGTGAYLLGVDFNTVTMQEESFADGSIASAGTSSPADPPAMTSNTLMFAAVVQNTAIIIGNPPPAPTGLTATGGISQVALNWTAASGAASYNLYRSTTSGGEGSTPYQTGLTGTSFTDTGVSDGTTYYYTVTAVNSAGESGQSAEASATPQAPPSPPATPLDLTATAGNAQVSLSWSAVTGAASYNLYRSTTSGGEGSTPFQSGLTATTFMDSTVVNGTTYYYTVTAVNSAGESGQSTEASATPQAPPSPPAAPLDLTATAGSNLVTLNWSAVAGAASYNVYRSTTPGGEGAIPYQTGIATNSFTDNAVTPGTTYYYTVTAVNAAGESPQSAEASATLIQTAPPEETFRVLTLNDAMFFHLDFSVQSATQPGAAMAITVFDPAGNIVYSAFLASGQSASVDLFLAPGTYVFRFVGGTADGAPLQPLSFQVNGLEWNDPIGPALVDPNSPPPPAFQWIDPTTVTQWLQYGLYKFLTFIDAYNSHPLPLQQPAN